MRREVKFIFSSLSKRVYKPSNGDVKTLNKESRYERPMIRISKTERAALEKVGLLKYKLQHSRKHETQDSNFVTLNVNHSGRSKHTMITETTDVLIFLGKWDMVNCLQKIRPDQFNELKQKGLIKDNQIQRPYEYNPDAIAFIAYDGTIRIYKTASLMKAAGIWD